MRHVAQRSNEEDEKRGTTNLHLRADAREAGHFERKVLWTGDSSLARRDFFLVRKPGIDGRESWGGEEKGGKKQRRREAGGRRKLEKEIQSKTRQTHASLSTEITGPTTSSHRRLGTVWTSDCWCIYSGFRLPGLGCSVSCEGKCVEAGGRDTF